MCNQTVCLVQAALEREGITTVSISLLREVVSALRPPRALWVPFPMGYPMGKPNDAALQHRVLAAALTLLSRNDVPVLADFPADSC
ncbi:MAG: hypothetical protein JNJ50_25045 [Acidobacteria bacterium]|nr:hypothetical protein [Acidobacteriota bacterium]